MKSLLLVVLVLGAATVGAPAATTINAANHFTYGANLGWMDWRGDVSSGAVIGEFFCSGFIYSANAGWISLGGGSPANGIRYQNNSATDFGVNHDGAGNLRGYAYGANIGWLTFTNRDANGAIYAGPQVDLLTGRLSGFVWSANGGWISLSNQFAFVQTDSIAVPGDSDGDGIPDAWERLNFGNLTTASAASDFDGDGFKDASEYLAGTDPLDGLSNLRITSFHPAVGMNPAALTWTSVSTRLYRVERINLITTPAPWPEFGLGLIPPDVGITTTRTFAEPASDQRYFRVRAEKPLP